MAIYLPGNKVYEAAVGSEWVNAARNVFWIVFGDILGDNTYNVVHRDAVHKHWRRFEAKNTKTENELKQKILVHLLKIFGFIYLLIFANKRHFKKRQENILKKTTILSSAVILVR